MATPQPRKILSSIYVNQSKKQRELLSFIDTFIKSHGYGPSYREVMQSLDYRSVSTVAKHIDNLVKKGHLIKRDGSARSLEVVGGSEVKAPDNNVSASEEKWLVNLITKRFSEAEGAQSLSRKEIDNLFVLVGALHVLGLEAAANAFKPRLGELQQQIDGNKD